MNKEIEFNENDLMEGLNEALNCARARQMRKTTKVPDRMHTMSLSSTTLPRLETE
jgi:hypothetical protein